MALKVEQAFVILAITARRIEKFVHFRIGFLLCQEAVADTIGGSLDALTDEISATRVSLVNLQMQETRAVL